MARAVIALLLLVYQLSAAARPELGLVFGRATDSQDIDIARLSYRHPLTEKDAWWMPTHLQLGAGVWRVPDIRGTARRFNVSATPGKNAYLGIALQHLSNAGIKQPNGGIDLILVQYTVSTGTPKR